MHSKEKQRSQGLVVSAAQPLYIHSSEAIRFPITDATKMELVSPINSISILSRVLISIDSHSLLGFRHVDVFLNTSAQGIGAGMLLGVEYFPGMHMALGSFHNATKKGNFFFHFTHPGAPIDHQWASRQWKPCFCWLIFS